MSDSKTMIDEPRVIHMAESLLKALLAALKGNGTDRKANTSPTWRPGGLECLPGWWFNLLPTRCLLDRLFVFEEMMIFP